MTQRVPVPAEDAEGHAIVKFAHTYDGYTLHGSLETLTAMVEPVRDHWRRTGELIDYRTGELIDDIDVLRACLFLEARAHRHGGYEPFDQEPFPAALMTRIRALSGGSVPLRSTKIS